MADTNANISIGEIVDSWLFARGKTIHYYLKALALAAECIRELQLTSLPMLRHTLLTRNTGENWFNLPEGYTDYVRIGYRIGDVWTPIQVADRLMPYRNTDGVGDAGSDFGDDFNTSGNNISWYGTPGVAADFNPADYSASDMLTASTDGSTGLTTDQALIRAMVGGNISGGYQRWNGVSFDTANGVIVCPEGFWPTELYLVYVGIGTVDNMTEVPVIAQAAIEAYMDWKYAFNKRNGKQEARYYEPEKDNQHRILRARIAKWTPEKLINAFESRFHRGRIASDEYFIGGAGNNGNSAVVTPDTEGFDYFIFPYNLS